MKVTITPEAFALQKELMQYTTRNKQLEKTKGSAVFPLTAVPNLGATTLLPSIKSVTELQVKSPRIRISDAFANRYPKLPSALPKIRKVDNSQNELQTTKNYLKTKIELAFSKAKNVEEMRQAEINYRKLLNIHELQLKKWENVFARVRQARENEEASLAEKVEKFRIQFDDMTMKFEEQLLVDTRKRRLKERIARLYLHKYSKIWDNSRTTTLSLPTKVKRKYIDIRAN